MNLVAPLLLGLRSMFSPRMVTLMVWPMLLATLVWGLIAYFFWSEWSSGLSGLAAETDASAYLYEHDWGWLEDSLVTAVLVILLIPVIVITGLVITAIFGMPMMVERVAGRYFPHLERKRGGTFAGSLWNGLVAVGVYVVLFAVTLPLWLLFPLGAVVPVLLSAYLNQRLFRYDALAEHASPEEFRRVLECAGLRPHGLGVILTVVQFTPILHFFAPVYIGLVYVHFYLGELAALRTARPALPAPARRALR